MQLQRSGSVCLLKWRIRKFIFLRSVASRPHKSPYAVLGVAPKADIKEIKEKFYKLSKEHHPDISKNASSMEKFREIAEAYETLSNPELRNKYDQVSGFSKTKMLFRKMGWRAGSPPYLDRQAERLKEVGVPKAVL